MSNSPHVKDVSLADFETEVLARSHDVPVVVDFWAEWCGPCRTLGPAIEKAVDGRGGQVILAKVDVDANQALAQKYGVRGIPAVKAFKDGHVVDEFVGAVPPHEIENFLDRIVPNEADRIVAEVAAYADSDPERAEIELWRALTIDANHLGAAVAMGDLLIAKDPREAIAIVNQHRPHPGAEAVVARAELAMGGGADLAALLAAVSADPTDAEAHLAYGSALCSAGQHEEGLEHLLTAVRIGGDAREPARESILGVFTALGDEHELVRAARPKLTKALF